MSNIDHIVPPVGTPHFYAADITGLAAIVGAYTGILQGMFGILATFAAVVWYGVQIYAWFEARYNQRRQRVESEQRALAALLRAEKDNDTQATG